MLVPLHVSRIPDPTLSHPTMPRHSLHSRASQEKNDLAAEPHPRVTSKQTRARSGFRPVTFT